MALVVLPYLQTYKSAGRTYAYYRRGSHRVRLAGEPGSTEFLISYQAAHAAAEGRGAPTRVGRTQFADGSAGALIAAFKASHEYRILARATRAGYDAALAVLPAPCLHFDVSKLTRTFIIVERDKLADTPNKANYFVSVLRLVLFWGMERDWLKTNPAQKIKKLKTGKGYRAWTDAEIAAFTAADAGVMVLPVMLALYTGQRLADVLRLPWSAYDGQTITLTQGKTGAKVAVHVHPQLKAALDVVTRSAVTICTRADGHSWKIDHFKHTFTAKRRKLGLAEDLHFHGLRHSAASRLAEAGASDAEIQSVTGHKTRAMVVHYSAGARQKELAKNAIERLPGGRKKNTTV